MFEVKGKPFLMLAGEVHNSNSSSLAAMEPVWEKAERLGMNSLLLPVTWELVEPREGEFQFGLVDGLILEARKRGMRLGFLWFGAWKNAQCMYAPEWVKTDMDRFPRAQVKKGQNKVELESFHGMSYTTLSCHCAETLKADSTAFAALMKHIKEVDGTEGTVLYVQVENEAGLMGAAREHSDLADDLFAGQAPEDFVRYMREQATLVGDIKTAVENGNSSGSWEDVFGPAAEEIFHTYHVAKYIDAVAAAGKVEYDLPMAVNAWLDQGGGPGAYPTGGPINKVLEIWKFCAPHIDMLCPDIYVRNFCEVCDQYTRLGGPLVIPETATHGHAGPRAVYTVGHYHAWCFSPFGFEEMGEPFSAHIGFLFGMDTSDPLLRTPQDVDEYRWYNRTLSALMPLLTQAYGTDRLQAVISEVPEKDTMGFGELAIQAVMDSPMLSRKDGVCLAMQISDDEFYVIANACALRFLSTDPAKPHVDILSLEEGALVDGKWDMLRRLNGDEASMLMYDTPTLLKVKLFAYS